MIIQVTEQHIKDGVPKEASMCPLALAIKEHFGATSSSVGCYMSYVVDGNRIVLHFPPEAATFMNKFDRGEEVKPFSFTTQEEQCI